MPTNLKTKNKVQSHYVRFVFIIIDGTKLIIYEWNIVVKLYPHFECDAYETYQRDNKSM